LAALRKKRRFFIKVPKVASVFWLPFFGILFVNAGLL